MLPGKFKNRFACVAGLIALAGLASVGSLAPVRADVQSYASQRRQIKACVLVSAASSEDVTVNGQNVNIPENATPYVFYVLDRRTDLKPSGWEFVNPLAPSMITPDMLARWQLRYTNNAGLRDRTMTGAGSPFQLGAPLSKNIGAYWEVNLDNITPEDLQQFDVVLMAYHRNLSFTPDEREKLRRYADGGGTIWLEDEGGIGIPPTNGQFIVDLSFTGGSPTLPILGTSHHPLFNFPFALTGSDVSNLGGNLNTHLHVAPGGGYANPRVLVPVVYGGAGASPMISAGDFGAGHLVVSSASIATAINRAGGANVDGEGPNSGGVSGNQLLAASPTNMEFAYNLIAWTSSVPTANGNSHRTSASSENLGSQLGKKWQTVPVAASGLGSGAVVHKGVVFYVDGSNVLHAYDLNPQTDLDNDGNPDDGLQDPVNSPYDEIWRVDLGFGGRVGTPTILSVYDPIAGTPRDIVTVTLSNSKTLAFDAFPRTASGRLAASPGAPLWTTAAPNTGDDVAPYLQIGDTQRDTPSPSGVFSEGVFFTMVTAAGNNPDRPWRIAPIDPLTGNNIFGDQGAFAPSNQSFQGGGTSQTPVPNAVPDGLPPIAGSLTAGYVRDDPTGAIDKVIYVPTHPRNTNAGVPQGGGALYGIWFSTHNEPLTATDPGTGLNGDIHYEFRPTGERARLPWFAPPSGTANSLGQPARSLLPIVHRVFRDPVTGLTRVTRLTYPADFTVEYRPNNVPNGGVADHTLFVHIPQGIDSTTDTISADYTLDWPGDKVGDALASPGGANILPNATEMGLFSTARRFTLYSPDISQKFFFSGPPALTPQDLLIVGAGDYSAQSINPDPLGDRIYAIHDQFTSGTTNTTAARGRARTTSPGTTVAWMFSPTSGFNVGTYNVPPRLLNTDNFTYPADPNVNANAVGTGQTFYDQESEGTPAVSNGVVYSVMSAHVHGSGFNNATVIMALRADPDMSFTVPTRIPNDGSFVTLRQLDTLQSTAATPRFITLVENVNFTLDRDTSTFHMTNLRAGVNPNNGDSFNTSLPIYLQVGPTSLPDAIVNPQTGFGPLDNLLWFMIIPAGPALNAPLANTIGNGFLPASGPSIVGNTLHFGTQDGRIVSIDLPPGATGQVKMFADDGTPRVHVQAAMTNGTGGTVIQKIIHPPLATTGVMVVGTPNGLSALDNQLTLIADSSRLIEVNAAGDVTWTMEASRAFAFAGGGSRGTSQVATTKISLSRPNVARRIGLNAFIIADTGNNRILQADKGGVARWEIHSLLDDMHFLGPNDPVTLNQPTDVDSYTRTGNGPISFKSGSTNVTYSYTGPWTAIHYLVSDSGNFRALEIVDVYDGNGNPVILTSDNGNYSNVTAQRQVIFVTHSLAEQNLRYRYRTIQQFFDPQTLNTFIIAAVDNVRQAALDAGTVGFGADGSGAEASGGSLAVIRRYPTTGRDGDIASIVNSIAIPDATGGVRHQAISSPTWFKQYAVADPGSVTGQSSRYLLADANGCYVLHPQGNEAVVEWMLTAQDYLYLTGRKLRAASIQRLNQADASGGTFYPRYLITNRYSGQDDIATVFGIPGVPRGEVHGEVVEIRSDYYFNGGYFNNPTARLYALNGPNWLNPNPASAITWIVPKEEIPPFPGIIKRRIGKPGGGSDTFTLEEPTFSDRPY